MTTTIATTTTATAIVTTYRAILLIDISVIITNHLSYCIASHADVRATQAPVLLFMILFLMFNFPPQEQLNIVARFRKQAEIEGRLPVRNRAEECTFLSCDD